MAQVSRSVWKDVVMCEYKSRCGHCTYAGPTKTMTIHSCLRHNGSACFIPVIHESANHASWRCSPEVCLAETGYDKVMIKLVAVINPEPRE